MTDKIETGPEWSARYLANRFIRNRKRLSTTAGEAMSSVLLAIENIKCSVEASIDPDDHEGVDYWIKDAVEAAEECAKCIRQLGKALRNKADKS